MKQPRRRARVTVCLGLALSASTILACAHARPVTVPISSSLAASEARQDWITERLRAMRAARKEDPSRAAAIRRELEQAAVDWRSFLTPIRGSEGALGGPYGLWMKDQFLRQLVQKVNVVRDVRKVLHIPDRANDLARDGRVLDSAFFTNRDVAAIDTGEVRSEAQAHAPQGTIFVTKRKGEGTSEGFWGRDMTGDPYIFILDPKGFPGLSTAAEVIGSTIERLAGYQVPYSSIVNLEDLRLDPAAAAAGKVTERDLEQFRGRRAVATLGGHNTLIDVYDAEAGLVRYFVIDFSSALGASSAKVKSPQDGWVNKTVDVNRGITWPLREIEHAMGRKDPWDPHAAIVSPAVGRFDANLDPRRWKSFYPNLAFEDMDDEDARWAALIVRQFSNPLIEAVVRLARYSSPADAAYVARTLEERRDVIEEAYLGSETTRP
jgi:hypothetical protein